MMNSHLLVEQLQPGTRLVLVESRCNSMKGQLSAARQDIDSTLLGPGAAKAIDKVVLAMLKAELLELDGRPDAALQVFDEGIVKLLPEVDEAVQFVARRNRTQLLAASMHRETGVEFYRLVDESRLFCSICGTLKLDPAPMMLPRAASTMTHCRVIGENCSVHIGRLAGDRGVVQPRRFVRCSCSNLSLLDEAAYHAVQSDDEDIVRDVGKAPCSQ